MKIKNTLLSFLSFGEGLKIKNEDNYPYSAACKLTNGASAVKSSLAEKDLKAVLITALINTLPFAAFGVLILGILTAVGGVVLNTVNHFCAGFLCYFIFVLIELFKSNINHYKKSDILKPSLIIAGVTFILTCGTVIRQIYHLITNEYLQGTIFDFSAVSIIFALVFVAVLTKGEPKPNLNTLMATIISVLFLASNITYLKTVSFVVYIRLALVLAMLVLMIYTVIKDNKGTKLNLKAPLIILGSTVGIAIIISLVLHFVFGDINQVKFALSTTFAAIFGTDVNSLALLENTVGGGAVTDNSSLYGIISVISYIAPGSYLINALTMAGFNMGFHGENALIVGILYAVMGFVLAVGLTITVISVIIEWVKNGKETATLVAIKRWVSAVILGLIPVTVLAMASTFLNLLRVSFSGIFGLLFAVAMVAIIYILCNNYKVNRNLVAILSGVFTVLVMIFSSGVAIY